MSRLDNRWTFAYDDDDLASSQMVNYPHMGGANSFTFSYGYYPDGSRETLTVSCLPVGSNTFTSTYNGRGDWTGLSNPYGESSSWSYYDNGWLQTQTLGNGATTTASYNAIGQLLDLSNKKSGGTVLSDFSMTGAGHYDGAGNLLSLTASLPAAPGSYSGTTSLQYDSHDQLNREQSSRLGAYTNTFAFDGAGNPTTFKGATQTFNTANQNNAIPYDGDGNPKTWQSNNLTFDAGNHLTAIGATLTAGYNAEGLRAWKQSASGTTYFLYDGLTPVVELDNNANVKAVNTWGANGLLSRRTVSTNSSVFYTFDEQGSTAQRLDSGGNILGSYGFDAFGTRASTDNSTDPYSGFGAQWGYYRDSETGLSLCGERYYDPGQGRWLNRDPIGYAGGLNVYAYVGSNPMAGIDPSGKFIFLVIPAGIALGLLVGSLLIDSEQPAGEPNPNYQHTTPTHDFLLMCEKDTVDPPRDSGPDQAGTKPTLPPRLIYQDRGVRIVHNYHDPLPGTPTEHGPAHAHVTGGDGPETRIGPKGYPLSGDPEPTRVQRAVIEDAGNGLRRALNKCGKWLKWCAEHPEEGVEIAE